MQLCSRAMLASMVGFMVGFTDGWTINSMTVGQTIAWSVGMGGLCIAKLRGMSMFQ